MKTDELFFFQSPGPIMIDWGFLTIRWYGFLTALAFLSALFFIHRIARNRVTENGGLKLDEEIDNFALLALVTGLIGARLWFVILNASYFLQNPNEIWQIWLGGQSIQGGIIGGIFGTWLYDCILRHKSWGHYLSKLASIAVALPLAQAIGRWGNFFNEEAFGSVTELPWKLYISHTGLFHHPTFLYESIWNLLSFYILSKTHKQLNDYQVIGLYLVIYSTGRLVLENLRTDSLMLWDLPAASVIASISLIIGLGLLLQTKTKL